MQELKQVKWLFSCHSVALLKNTELLCPYIAMLMFPQVHVNPSQSVLVLEGDDIESFNRAVQQVTYRNSLRFATPGVRPLKLSTSLR